MHMKKKKPDPMPLTAIRNLKENHPDVWQKVDANDINSAVDYANSHNISESAYIIAALARWRLSKQIFEIDEELCKILIETDKLDEDIPNEIINRLIYNSFYVKLPDKFITVRSVNGEDISLSMDGFFYNVIGKSIIIVIMYSSGHTQSLGFDIYPDTTLRECIEKHMSANSDVYKTINFFLQMILYLCADNADIEENKVQRSVYKPSPIITDRYTEVRKWDVGWRYGNAIKRSRNTGTAHTGAAQAGSSHAGSHARKRTHVRRGHYHHFWIGSERSGDRELILKWISPVVVNSEYENTTTIHKVK